VSVEKASSIANQTALPGAGATQPRFYGYIDALRGLAFVAVLLLHTRDRIPDLPRLLDDVCGRGYAGVQLFFVVSAFTLCQSLSARSAEAAPLQTYFLRRAFRIVPMFWCAIALYLAVYGFSDASPRWGIPGGLSGQQLTLAVLLLHGFDIHAVNGVVPGGWSVATEVQFYLVLPLMLTWASTLRRALLLFGSAAVVSIVSFPGLEALLGPLHPASERIYVHAFAFFALPTQIPVFCCGLVLFRLMTSRRAIAPKSGFGCRSSHPVGRRLLS
jgi:peptidoglycan/LPS O-acetylase OafA/YrhL